MNEVSLIANLRKPNARKIVFESVEWLQKRGVSVAVSLDLASHAPKGALSYPENELSRHGEMLLAMGGDGTMLRAARIVGRSGKPILGINLGSLGFLTEISLEELYPTMERVLAGDYRLEGRMVLEALVERSGQTFYALNDVVIRAPSRVVELEVSLDGQYVSSYLADGLIVSTPTGSTAYSLACAGPILHPTMETLIVTPICPHTLAIRPMIVSATQTVEATVYCKMEEPLITADGQVTQNLLTGDRIAFRKASYTISLVRATGKTFYEILRAKLKWVGQQERPQESS
jgi:NAD+ kinase